MGLGLVGRCPLSLHSPALGDPLPCFHGLLLGEGKPMVDHLEKEAGTVRMGMVIGERRPG